MTSALQSQRILDDLARRLQPVVNALVDIFKGDEFTDVFNGSEYLPSLAKLVRLGFERLETSGGYFRTFDTKALAAAAVGSLPEGQYVQVLADESRTSSRVIYQVTSGALSFRTNLDQLRLDLAAVTGASEVKTASGASVEDELSSKLDASQNLGDLVSLGEALGNLGIINLQSRTLVTGAQTLSLSALGTVVLISDSATPADFTTVLPAAAPAGSVILVYVDDAFTKLATINGNDVGIEGDADRIMWRSEWVLLIREGGNWKRLGGRTIPFRGYLRLTTNVALAAGTATIVPFNAVGGDFTGLNLFYDAANNRVKPPRKSSYQVTFNGILAANNAATHVEFGILFAPAAGTPMPQFTANPCAFADVPNVTTSGARPSACVSNVYPANAIGGFSAVVRCNGGAGVLEAAVGIIENTLSIIELPIWP